MAVSVRSALWLAPIMATTGCGIFGGDGGGGFIDTAPVYQTFDSTAPVTSGVASTGVRGGTDGSVTVTQGTGALAHANGALDLDDGTYSITDVDGPSGSGLYTDGTSFLSRGNPNLDTSGYQYVTGYNQVYNDGGVTYETDGLIGVVTRLTEVPTTGTARYTGNAYATVTQGPTTTTLSDGTSEINANFGARTVDATLSNFQRVTDASGNRVAAPIDRIQAAGMSIDGNTFEGNSVFTQLGQNVVTVTGPATSTTAGGTFFGYDSDAGVPDEVGGIINLSGPAGRVTGGFVAD